MVAGITQALALADSNSPDKGNQMIFFFDFFYSSELFTVLNLCEQQVLKLKKKKKMPVFFLSSSDWSDRKLRKTSAFLCRFFQPLRRGTLA